MKVGLGEVETEDQATTPRPAQRKALTTQVKLKHPVVAGGRCIGDGPDRRQIGNTNRQCFAVEAAVERHRPFIPDLIEILIQGSDRRCLQGIEERGIVIDEVTRAAQGDYESLITLSVTTQTQERAVAGTVFQDGKPRILSIKGIKVDAEFAPSMIYVTNEDKPGFIGRFASLLGEAGVNIATFALGRDVARELERAHGSTPPRFPSVDPTAIPMVDGKPRLDDGPPAGSVKEFVAAIKASPDKYSYASFGSGTTSHFAGELVLQEIGRAHV